MGGRSGTGVISKIKAYKSINNLVFESEVDRVVRGGLFGFGRQSVLTAPLIVADRMKYVAERSVIKPDESFRVLNANGMQICTDGKYSFWSNFSLELDEERGLAIINYYALTLLGKLIYKFSVTGGNE